MSSVKKSEKSRKSKASVAKAAAKSRYSGAKASKRSSSHKARSASMPRNARAASKSAAKRAQTAKAKAPARKPAATSASKTAAAKARAARARLKKLAAEQAAAKAAARKAAAQRAAKSGSARVKVTHAPAPHGKAPVERAVTQAKAPKVAERQGAAHHGDAKKPVSVHRAQAQAVLALRAAAAKPVAPPRKEEMSKATVLAKSQKKPAEAAPESPRPVAPAAPAVAVKPPIHAPEAKPAAAIAAKAAKPVTAAKLGFKPLEFIVYPAHGVGQILAVEEQEVAGFKLELFVISFAKDKMILKVPTPKTISVGMRKLASAEIIKRALDTLTGRARIKRTMWSRRAQEYEAKINSGDLIAIAEVVRDLYRSEAQPEQSYSERQLYEAALDRVSREIAAVQKLTETEALKLIESQLQKSPRRGKADDGEADTDADPESIASEADEGGIDEAA